MKRLSYIHGIIVILILCFIPEFSNAQTKGSVSGTIKDNSGLSAASINVTLQGSTLQTATDIDGNFKIFEVESGQYTISVSGIGYKTKKQAVSVVSGQDTRIDLVVEDDLLSLDEVVVTGSSNPRTKIESSVAITTLGIQEISRIEPQSAADVLKVIPGFYVETSGGAVGNNLFARGIPSVGAYEYVQIQEDGLPVFEDGALQFANADNFFRFDETIDKVEAIKGGSGSIFATNAPGGIINLISKRGSNDFKGVYKLSTGMPNGLLRNDFNVSGPLVKDKLFFSIGGFYRTDEGVRDPGFTANKGGQVKANLRYEFDKGYVQVFYKKLDDRNIFYLGVPLTGKDNPKGAPGFNANYGTLTSSNFSRLKVPQVGGGYFERDLEDGIHPVVDALGAVVKVDIDEQWTIKNSFKNTNIDQTYTAIFPGADPQSAANFAANYKGNLALGNPIYSYVDTGEIANPNLVAELGYWAIDKKMQNFVNNFNLNYNSEKVNLTFGYYYSNWKSTQYWNWSNILAEISDNPRLLNLVDGNKLPTDTNYSRTYNGVSSISWLTRDGQTKGILNAFYANAEIKASENLNIDLGIRYDMDRYSGYKSNNETASLGIGNTSADDNVSVIGSTFTYWKYDVNRISFSAAANYKFTENMAAYVRFSNGFRSPVEEALYDNAPKFEGIKETVINQLEFGYKYNGSNFALFANAFYMKLDNIAFTDILLTGQSENKFASADNIGLEIEANYKIGKLYTTFRGTIQNPEFKDFSSTDYNYSGNTVRRIPKTYFTLSPSYDITDKLNAFVQWGFYGKKFSDNANEAKLPSYSEFDLGAGYKIKNVLLAFSVKNVFNAVGLTEGNPRVAGTQGDVYYARPIMGTHGTLSMTYRF